MDASGKRLGQRYPRARPDAVVEGKADGRTRQVDCRDVPSILRRHHRRAGCMDAPQRWLEPARARCCGARSWGGGLGGKSQHQFRPCGDARRDGGAWRRGNRPPAHRWGNPEGSDDAAPWCDSPGYRWRWHGIRGIEGLACGQQMGAVGACCRDGRRGCSDRPGNPGSGPGGDRAGDRREGCRRGRRAGDAPGLDRIPPRRREVPAKQGEREVHGGDQASAAHRAGSGGAPAVSGGWWSSKGIWIFASLGPACGNVFANHGECCWP